MSDWYCKKFGLTNLLGHDGKVMSDKKMISMSQQRCEGLNRDYWINISVILKKTGKFLIVFCKIDLRKKGKTGVDGVIGQPREIDIRYKPNLKVLLKCLGCK